MVPADLAGKRLDQAAAALMSEFSRSRLKTWIDDGRPTVDGASAQPKSRLAGGEELALETELEPVVEVGAEAIPLNVVWQDEQLFVIDKPAGLVVHPGAGHESGTLVNALLAHCGDSLSGIGGVRRPGIVHRLDKDTSGLMVVAKTDAAHRSLAAQFADHGKTGPLERAYLALVWGAPPRTHGTIDKPIGSWSVTSTVAVPST